jgi:hypothetical protein
MFFPPHLRHTLAAVALALPLLAACTSIEVTPEGCHGPPRPAPIESMTGPARSSLMPGAAETVGVGALTGHLLIPTAITAGSQIANQTQSADGESEAVRLGEKIADQLKTLFAQQGWIAGS